mmetsp:Transcript_18454/g.50667  ORF Transcript_18454/g.50667 Transcript_18454/m.50667 type:complete len:283 (+) Transcript_18454:142-990(+)
MLVVVDRAAPCWTHLAQAAEIVAAVRIDADLHSREHERPLCERVATKGDGHEDGEHAHDEEFGRVLVLRDPREGREKLVMHAVYVLVKQRREVVRPVPQEIARVVDHQTKQHVRGELDERRGALRKETSAVARVDALDATVEPRSARKNQEDEAWKDEAHVVVQGQSEGRPPRPRPRPTCGLVGLHLEVLPDPADIKNVQQSAWQTRQHIEGHADGTREDGHGHVRRQPRILCQRVPQGLQTKRRMLARRRAREAQSMPECRERQRDTEHKQTRARRHRDGS